MGRLTTRREGTDTIYSNGTYLVRVTKDGFIDVKPGDWLSKYSAAIYDNFNMLDVFYELDENGKRKVIPNKNLIKAGDTLVWWDPKLHDEKPGTGPGGDPGAGPMTREKFLEELMAKSRLKGDRAQAILDAVNILSVLEINFSLTELLAATLAMGGETGAVAVAGAAAEVMTGLGSVLFVVEAVIEWANALEEGLRNVGICAIAYGATAWAFGEKHVPWLPQVFEDNLRRNGKSNWHIIQSRAAWSDSIRRTAKNLEKKVADSGLPKASLQAWVMGMGGTPVTKKNTCYALWHGLSREVPAGSRRMNFESIVPDYPSAFALTRNR